MNPGKNPFHKTPAGSESSKFPPQNQKQPFRPLPPCHKPTIWHSRRKKPPTHGTRTSPHKQRSRIIIFKYAIRPTPYFLWVRTAWEREFTTTTTATTNRRTHGNVTLTLPKNCAQPETYFSCYVKLPSYPTFIGVPRLRLLEKKKSISI